MTTEALGQTIRRVLRDAPFAMRQLAADAGLSYDVLRSWRSGRRRPSRPSAQRLADGLERRGQQLLDLSRELRQVAGGDSVGDGAAETEGALAAPHEGAPELATAGPPQPVQPQENRTSTGFGTTGSGGGTGVRSDGGGGAAAGE